MTRASAKKKSLRDDPEVQSMTRLLMTGRASELTDIIGEVRGRIDGTRGWGGRRLNHEDNARDVMTDLLKWLEAREAHLSKVMNA